MRPAADAPLEATVVVVATRIAIPAEAIAAAVDPEARAVELIARAPVFWTRVSLARPALASEIADRLRAAAIPIRYVASAEQPSLVLAPALAIEDAPVVRPVAWAARAAATLAPIAETTGHWFLRASEGGVAVDRSRGSGAGMRLAVIDDDALGAEELDLDAEVLLGVEKAPRNQPHGALMVAWAVGAQRFEGVAPAASPRLYIIPKAGRGLMALPLAIARAVLDGADIVVCATYVEGTTSPMLDDALEIAARLGRGGRGTAVVLPTGREASSAGGSVHASFSLGLGEPASDPRVICVGPGARGHGWFFWRDRRGRSRPFANRGPALRWLAPGDDITYPFTSGAAGARADASERLFHAESSGAAAIAAGVLLAVLGENPTLRVSELGAIVDATLEPIAPDVPASRDPLADPADALPVARDADGHNAKHGHGLVSAGRACLAAADPIAGALLAMGEEDAARAWIRARLVEPAVRRAYSRRLGRWAVRALLADREASRALKVVLRHLRLTSARSGRFEAHGEGAVLRDLGLLLRKLAVARPRATAHVRAELVELTEKIEASLQAPGAARALEARIASSAATCFGAHQEPP